MSNELAVISLDFENNTITGVLHGRQSTLRKQDEDIYIGEEADLVQMLFEASTKHTKDRLHYQIEPQTAQLVWKKLVENGWKP